VQTGSIILSTTATRSDKDWYRLDIVTVKSTEVAIVGGGLQGCCIALELARQEMDVILIEQDNELMNRASLRNEGKIHLGLVYANDLSLATARYQIKGALAFRQLLQRWTGCSVPELGVSTPFHYLVAVDSIVPVDQVCAYYDRLNETYAEYLRDNPGLDYLGTRPDALSTAIDHASAAVIYQHENFQRCFATAELAINTQHLAEIVRRAVMANERIDVRTNTRADRAVCTNGSLYIECVQPGQKFRVRACSVVNATWADRLSMDSEFGIKITPGWVHRLKYRVITKLPDSFLGAPSVTMVLGAYGDVVIRPDLTAYLSWYPTAMRGWSHELAPPRTWDEPCRGIVATPDAESMATQVIRSISAWYPGIEQGHCLSVDAGVIFAHGTTDIDDPASGLHARTHNGVTAMNGFYSVNPGKLTTAPLTAMAVARQITGREDPELGAVGALVN